MALPPNWSGRSLPETPPIRYWARARGSRLSSQPRTSFTRPRPTWLAVILRSRIQLRASGLETVSASRLCISTTSTPRSRILVTKSKWSRLAWLTQITSSNSSSSQLLGVRRWCARPGEQTITLCSLPASEWTPSFTLDMAVLLSQSKQLQSQEAVVEAVGRHQGTDNHQGENAFFDLGKDGLADFTFGLGEQNRARGVKQSG